MSGVCSVCVLMLVCQFFYIRPSCFLLRDSFIPFFIIFFFLLPLFFQREVKIIGINAVAALYAVIYAAVGVGHI